MEDLLMCNYSQTFLSLNTTLIETFLAPQELVVARVAARREDQTLCTSIPSPPEMSVELMGEDVEAALAKMDPVALQQLQEVIQNDPENFTTRSM